MTLPLDTTTLDVVYLAQPFCQVEAKLLNTKTLDIVYQAQPFFATFVSCNVFVNVGGTWKNAIKVYANVSGSWKSVVNNQLSANISSTWNP